MDSSDKPKTTLPAFTPVPRKCDRSNGWKPEVQRAFIEALADTGSVKSAARRVGRSEVGAYQLRRHPEGGGFAAAWEVALDLGVKRIEDAAIHRALYGIEVPVLSAGKQFGTRRVYNERLVMFILRNRRPEKYSEGGAHGLSAVDRMRIKRLKEGWRREWAEQQRAAEPDIEQVRAEVIAKVAALQAHERRRWTPREHELHAALEAERAARKAREEEEEHERFRALNLNARQWEELEADEAADDDACPEPPEPVEGRGGPPLIEPRAEPEPEPAPAPRIRTLKDDKW